MSAHEPMGVAVVGCGRIAEHYGKSLCTKPDKVRLVGGYDVIPERAQEYVAEHGGKAYDSYDALLSDDEVQIVLNLTIQQEHASVTERAFSAGKHVHSEKPLACSREDGQRLLQVADDCGLRLSCSPFTFLGEAQQTFIKAAQDQAIGTPLVAYSEMNWGAIERGNPRPVPYYEKGAGPLLELRWILRLVAKARHDINNPLTAGLAETQLVLMDEPKGDLLESLEVIENQLRRIKDLVAGLARLRVKRS